jgi:hypothetical protein
MARAENNDGTNNEALTEGRAPAIPATAEPNKRGKGRGGPRTAAGKTKVSRNAIKHGILSASPVIPGENRRDWEDFQDNVLTHLHLVGGAENALGQQIAFTLWRRDRLIRYETQSIRSVLETVEDDAIVSVHKRLAAQGLACPDDPEALVVLLAEWDELEDAEPLHVEAAIDVTRALTLGFTDTVDFAWPGLPPDVTVGDYDGWTVGQVREGIDALARLRGCSPADVLALGRLHAEAGVLASEHVNQLIEREEARLTAERLLGPVELTDRVIRLEAHLARMLARDFAQLEVLQARRAGTPTPLLRVDVNGGDT